MSLLDWSNLFATLLTFGCFSFAVTSFGVKLGRLSGFQNTSGYQYITEVKNSDKLFEDIVKVNSKDEKAPSWVKNPKQLRDRCQRYQYSLKYWNETAKYCLVQNIVRHQLIKDGVTLKEAPDEKCTENLLNNYSDGTESFSYLLAKKECKKPEPDVGSAPAVAEADRRVNGGGSANGGGSNTGTSTQT